MEQKNENNIWSSWPVIIFALFMFWPLGIYLLLKRGNEDIKVSRGVGNILRIIGIGICIFGGIGFLGCLMDENSNDGIVGCISIIIFGYALVVVGNKIIKEAKKVEKYLSVIINGHVRSIDKVASMVGRPYEVVKNDIQKMIDKGHLKKAFINESEREIVFPNFQPEVHIEKNATADVKSNAPRVVTCSCCGANNTIRGKYGECEYCGSPLQA